MLRSLRLRRLFEERGPFTAAEAKDAMGTTRKFAIPLLEHFDRQGLTERQGSSAMTSPNRPVSSAARAINA